MRSTAPFPLAVASEDVNWIVSGLLRDLAAVQASAPSRWGYKRAAAAVARLEEPLPALIQEDGRLSKIRHVGPASTRIILEVLATGHSDTVEHAVVASGRAADVRRRRSLRAGFLSRAEVARVLRTPCRDVAGVDDYLGDLQMHSRWSDGSLTIAELAAAGLARGYRYLAITDHSKGLPIAGGMSIEAMSAQHAEIDEINARFGGRFRVLKGLEANLLADGGLDVSADERRGLDVVLAAPHSKLRSADDQTARLIRAIQTPGVHILAHPRGRISSSREGVRADWDQVFAAAADARVAVEIDGDPARQDLDHTLARRALDLGCLFALDSDAHGEADLIYAETALAHARLAGIPAARIINCWPLDRLLEWLDGKS